MAQTCDGWAVGRGGQMWDTFGRWTGDPKEFDCGSVGVCRFRRGARL